MTQIKELIDTVKKDLEPNVLNSIKLMKEDDLIGLHFGLGMHIRNKYNLWTETFFKKIEVDGNTFEVPIHPDEVSHHVIEEIWKELNT